MTATARPGCPEPRRAHLPGCCFTVALIHRAGCSYVGLHGGGKVAAQPDGRDDVRGMLERIERILVSFRS